nr:protein FAR1-related sequence 5-like [Tanacetum cinerariifolium]
MNSENQKINDPSKTYLIEDIDINGYLFGCDDDEVNHDGIWEKPNEDQEAFKQWIRSATVLGTFRSTCWNIYNTQRAAEEDEDFKNINSTPVLSSIHPVKAKAGESYTKKIFELFQKEWIEATTNLTHETKSKSEEKHSYWVGRVNVDKKY